MLAPHRAWETEATVGNVYKVYYRMHFLLECHWLYFAISYKQLSKSRKKSKGRYSMISAIAMLMHQNKRLNRIRAST